MKPPRRVLLASLIGVALAAAAYPAASLLNPDEQRVPVRQTKWFQQSCRVPAGHLELVKRGLYLGRGPDVQVLGNRPHVVGPRHVGAHSGPWPYLQDVPLLFYGPGFIEPNGRVTNVGEATLADIAPTLAELLGMQDGTSYAGKVLDQALVPAADRPAPPKLIVTMVWDGVGWNVLDEYPNAWPTLKGLMQQGTVIDNAIAGSSPSVTPAIHATVGTGVFPARHGIVDIPQRRPNGKLEDSFAHLDARNLLTPTLADRFDPTVGNRAKVALFGERGWHLGLIGHGAAFDGGDRDIVALVDDQTEKLVTNPNVYSLPPWMNEVTGLARFISETDAEDGTVDGLWEGKALLDESELRLMTPAWTRFQTKLIVALLQNKAFGSDEITDLFYTNYKMVDLFQHRYTIYDTDVKSILTHMDTSLARLVDRFNEFAGAGNWVLVLTADHGAGVKPARVGGWPISVGAAASAVDKEFGAGVVQDMRAPGLWLNRQLLQANDHTLSDVATFLIDYTVADNAGGDLPPEFKDRGNEKLFAAAFPAGQMKTVLECARAS